MEFNILSSSIEVEGDDMVAIFRDAASGPLDDACGELSANIAQELEALVFEMDIQRILYILQISSIAAQSTLGCIWKNTFDR